MHAYSCRYFTASTYNSVCYITAGNNAGPTTRNTWIWGKYFHLNLCTCKCNVKLTLDYFYHTGERRRCTESNLFSSTNVCKVYQIIQTMKSYNTHHALFSCPELLSRNGFPQDRYHCTVTSFPAKDSNANLSLKNLTSLLRSASEMIQSRNGPQFTFQGTMNILYGFSLSYCCNTYLLFTRYS